MSGAIGVLLLLAARAAWADHGGPGTRDAGGIGLGWLFVAGLVVVLALAGWALFAPASDDEGPESEQRGRRVE
ncbi:MAG TPA: hypothetical protein VGX21_21125 [Methylomirabilota bacterium]|nr:hypothetical protein [Methylomirabilota bacterium]